MIKTDPDVIRFNFRLINRRGFQSNNNAQLQKASFNITLNNILINESKDFFVEVERFKISGTYIPNQIFRIQTGISQDKPNLGTYAITLRFNNIDYTEFLIFIPDDRTLPVPLPPSLNNGLQVKSEYYFIFTYSSFVKMINIALLEAFNNIVGLPGNVTSPPIFQYDPNTRLFSFMVQGSYIANSVQLFFNTNLYDLFTTFESFKVVDIANFAKNYNIVIRFKGDNIVPFTPIGGPTNTVDWLKMIQSGSSIESFDSVSRIVLETNLPISNEYSAGNELSKKNGILIAETLLSDSILIKITQTTRGYASFVQQTHNINGLTGGSIQNISLNARWFDRKGDDYPILIGPYQEIYVTIVFSKKNLRKNITIKDFINSKLDIISE